MKQWCQTPLALLYTNNDLAEVHSRQIIRVAHCIDYAHGEGLGYNLLACALRNKANFAASLSCSQKALTLFEAQNSTRGIAVAYNTMPLTYKRIADVQHVELLLRKALTFAQLALLNTRKIHHIK